MHETAGQFQIHFAGGIQHFQIDVILPRQAGDRLHFALGENSAHARARLQTPWSNLLVEPQSKRQADGVGVHVLAQAGNFVDERNLGGHKRSCRFARQFRRFVIRHQHRNPAHHQRMKNLFHGGNGFARRRPEENAVGPIEVLDRTPVREEHRLAHQQALQAFRMEHSFNLGRRTHPHRRDDRQHLEAACSARDAEYEFLQPFRGIFGEKNHLRLARQFFRVRGIHQPPRTHVAPNHFL